MGYSNFRRGLNYFLAKYIYKSECSDRLIDTLDEVHKGAVKFIWNKNIYLPSSPFLSVNLKRCPNGCLMSFSQLPFQTPDHCYCIILVSQYWCIPITVTSNDVHPNAKANIIFNGLDLNVFVPFIQDPSFVMLNTDCCSYFLLSYSPKIFERLINNINIFSSNEKISLLHDSYSGLKFKRQKIEIFILLLNLFVQEACPHIWREIARIIKDIIFFSKSEPILKYLKIYCNKLVTIAFVKTRDTYDTNLIETKLLFSIQSEILVNCGDSETINFLARMCIERIDHMTSLYPSLFYPAYAALLSNNDSKIFVKILNLYSQLDNYEEKMAILHSMDVISNPELLQQLFGLILNVIGTVEYYEIEILFAALLKTPQNHSRIIDFVG
ncbi:hypothetical protein HZS_4750 [Henneguya salminicola]|nr:hypothetical protein HZS_4750 [Henneguya salminicola]